MQKLLSAIRAILASFKIVMMPVFRAGKWTLEAVTVVTAPVIRAADTVLDAALSIPGRIIGGLRSGRGGGQQAADAAAQTDEQVRAAQEKNEAALNATQAARILQRACKWRAEGRDVSDLVDALPEGLRSYAKKLTIAECIRMSEIDSEVVISWISGKRGPLPGIRTPEEVASGVSNQKPAPAAARTPAPGAVETPAETEVLNILAKRIRARAAQSAHDDDADATAFYRAI